MQICDTLAALRKAQRLTQPQTAAYLTDHGRSVSYKTVSKWECGLSLPDAEEFLLLCRLYGVSDVLTVFLDSGSEEAPLNDLGRQRLLEYLRLLQSSEKYLAVQKPSPRRRTIALYDLPVSAGTGAFLDSDHYELIEADESVPISAAFAVRIAGDSMSPRFLDGQIVYVQQTPQLEPGDCGIFLLNGDAYCKLLGGNTEMELISINQAYAPIPVRETDELRIVGRVVA
ncbi:MAG: XRE family transcriptional regulator [Eubacteriales bacterium]|nr:XRE family transcriptional regulator [Eubacteriales bacterium]